MSLSQLQRPSTLRKLLVLALTIAPSSAFAYIDPNASGILYQLLFPLIAAIVSIYVFLKQWIVDTAKRAWHALVRLFHRGR